MNCLKVQMDILKKLEKQSTTAVLIARDEDNIYLSPEGHRAFIIPKKFWYLDFEKLLDGRTEANFKAMFRNADYGEDAVKTSDLKIMEKKITIVKISSTNIHLWVDQNLIKEFDSDCKFKITKNNAPCYIYENGILVGLVLPVRVNAEA